MRKLCASYARFLKPLHCSVVSFGLLPEPFARDPIEPVLPLARLVRGVRLPVVELLELRRTHAGPPDVVEVIADLPRTTLEQICLCAQHLPGGVGCGVRGAAGEVRRRLIRFVGIRLGILLTAIVLLGFVPNWVLGSYNLDLAFFGPRSPVLNHLAAGSLGTLSVTGGE